VGVFAFSASAHPQQVTARGFILKKHPHRWGFALAPQDVSGLHLSIRTYLHNGREEWGMQAKSVIRRILRMQSG
jgi:hypothetical protein